MGKPRADETRMSLTVFPITALIYCNFKHVIYGDTVYIGIASALLTFIATYFAVTAGSGESIFLLLE